MSSSSSSSSSSTSLSSAQQAALFAQAQTQRATLRSLQSAVATTAATEELGAATLTELARQGEALARTQARVDEADAHAEKGRHVLRGMSSLLGEALNKFRAAHLAFKAKAAPRFAGSELCDAPGAGSS